MEAEPYNQTNEFDINNQIEIRISIKNYIDNEKTKMKTSKLPFTQVDIT